MSASTLSKYVAHTQVPVSFDGLALLLIGNRQVKFSDAVVKLLVGVMYKKG